MRKAGYDHWIIGSGRWIWPLDAVLGLGNAKEHDFIGRISGNIGALIPLLANHERAPRLPSPLPWCLLPPHPHQECAPPHPHPLPRRLLRAPGHSPPPIETPPWLCPSPINIPL
eukprot:173171-Chlamydomonas_euryale.AAC.1